MRGLALVLALAAAACTPAKPPKVAAPPRVGTTIVTTCPNEAPALAEESADRPVGLPIDRICVYGTSAPLDKTLAIRVGEMLKQDDVRASLEALNATKMFDEMVVGAEARGDRAVVHVLVKERLRVEEVVYDGATVAKMTTPVEYGTPLDPFVLHAAARKIEGEYERHGYGAARITFITEPSSPGKVRVRFKVDEGPQWKLAKTSFPGAAKVSEADVRAAAGVATGTPWNPEAVDVVATKLTALYYDRGYINVRIEAPTHDVAADGSVTVVWRIAEGDLFKVGKVTFTGKPAEKLEGELTAATKTRAKAVFNRGVLAADLNRVRELFERRGKKVEVSPLTKTDQKQKTIDIEIELREGADGGS